MITIGSLFAGVGGLELGLSWALAAAAIAHEVAWQVELDDFCRGVLAMHFPNAKRFSDVRKVGRAELALVNIMCGGFPCTDVSVAGLGAGLDGEASGLWFEYLRVVTEIRPDVVVVENVSALVTRGLDVVAAGLQALGYCVHVRIIAASDVGAPHRRERLFIVAHAGGFRLAEGRREGAAAGKTGPRRAARAGSADVAHAARSRSQGGDAAAEQPTGASPRLGDADVRGEPEQEGLHVEIGRRPADAGEHAHVADADGIGVRLVEQRRPRGRPRRVRDGGQGVAVDDGARGGRHAEPGVGRSAHGPARGVDRWPARPGDAAALWEPARAMTTYSPTRAARLHALGNAVVPQVAAEVGAFVVEILKGETHGC